MCSAVPTTPIYDERKLPLLLSPVLQLTSCTVRPWACSSQTAQQALITSHQPVNSVAHKNCLKSVISHHHITPSFSRTTPRSQAGPMACFAMHNQGASGELGAEGTTFDSARLLKKKEARLHSLTVGARGDRKQREWRSSFNFPQRSDAD